MNYASQISAFMAYKFILVIFRQRNIHTYRRKCDAAKVYFHKNLTCQVMSAKVYLKFRVLFIQPPTQQHEKFP